MNLFSPARFCRAVRPWWVAGLMGLLATEALAQDTETAEPLPPASAAERPARTPRAPVSPRFELDLQAPDEVRELLERHLDLQRFVRLRDLDANELNRLLAQVPANARELLGTQGYFTPTIVVEPLQPPSPTAQAPAEGLAPLGTVRIRVEPGPPTRVTAVEVYFTGPIADSPQAAEQRLTIRREASQVLGHTFTQTDWDRTKTQALRGLTALRFPAGRLQTSLADIDANNQQARLYIELDSGPLQRISEVQVEGAERYDPAMVERIVRLAGLTPGSEYSLEKLQIAQQRMVDSGYFDAAFVYVEPTTDGESLPVKVQLRESKRQKLVLGVGGSTDNGARLSMEHVHNRVPGLDWRAKTVLQIERQDSLASTEWTSPLDERGWRWVSGLQLARQEDGLTTTTSQRVRLGRVQDTETYDRSFYLQYDRARADNPLLRNVLGNAYESSLSANYGWTRRRFDDPISPRSGHGLAVDLGVGTTLGTDRQPFARTHARWQGFWPLDAATPAGPATDPPTAPGSPATRWGRLALRLEGGAVFARDSAPVPQTQLFITGGDNTVRGYGLRDIGIVQADGSVLPGRYLGVVSLEWQRPVWGNGAQRSAFEHVMFVDGGAVANRAGDLKPRWGVGTGMRYNSPVGPLQLDLAYGLDTRRLRLHLNVGFVF